MSNTFSGRNEEYLGDLYVNENKIQQSEQLAGLEEAISIRYPDCTPDQIIEIRNYLISYITECINDDYEIAFLKNDGEDSILKVLRLIEVIEKQAEGL